MAERDLANRTLELLNKHFEVPEGIEDTAADDEDKARSLLVEVLTPVIRRMLDQSFEQLLNVLYRIDLPEPKVISLLEESAPEHVAANLTAAIVDRQLEKIKLREKYRQSPD
ncbi:hypothetical protein [uncultured Imperialibacter sp.]|uniref:hypothetical protein n=1 Tax=uncultured Imperialibacter sp. TaxID=1672639 RepID=UPI0030DA744B|tara:strand:+ start:1847 stop:2182 length:336 start_codon:yes stop_codon:yes gene_type:complete